MVDRNNPEANNKKAAAAPTGNASNPSPDIDNITSNQLLDEKAETYLRESANIEDMPDTNDEKEMNETMDTDN